MLQYGPITETIPSDRDKSMSVAAKRRVDNATDKPDLTMRRCLIENTAESNHVEYVHCLPRSTLSGVLDRLEFAWKMDYLTLNVDSRYNIIRLSPKFHKAFDAGKWLLLPETSIINEYHNVCKNGKFPDINNEVYRYKLLAISDMDEIPIHRLSPPPAPLRPSARNFTYFPHPYHDYPVITSHAHPRFIICNSGPKIQGQIASLQEEYTAHSRDIARVLAIWVFWTKKIPTRVSIRNKRIVDDDPSIKDEDSQKSASQRVHRSMRSKRKTRKGKTSPAPTSSRKKRLAKDGPWLDDETLHEFNQKTMLNDRRADIKKQLVMDWLSGVSHLEAGVNENLNDITDSNVAMNLGVEDTHMFMAGG